MLEQSIIQVASSWIEIEFPEFVLKFWTNGRTAQSMVFHTSQGEARTTKQEARRIEP